MDRNSSRRDDRRDDKRDDRRTRDDTRDHKPRYEQGRDRSRSPRRDRQNDRRRSPPPPRGPPTQRGPPPPRSDRDRDYQLSRDSAAGGPSPRRPDHRQASRGTTDSKLSTGGAVKQEKREDIKMAGGFEDEDSDVEMKRVMGFQSFRSTKETKVPGNDKNYGVYKVKKAEYRQYMNRVGGFNRPLDAM